MSERLESGEVRVVLRKLRPAPDPADLRGWRELLSTDDIERLGRLRSTKARSEVLASRSLLRGVLARTLDVDPRDWRFGSSAAGRPTILEPAELRAALWFSLSHTEGLVGCAIATANLCERGVFVAMHGIIKPHDQMQRDPSTGKYH